WTGWWPKRFRRPEDLWDRLPVAVRQFRAVLSAWVGLIPLTLVPVLRAGLGPPDLKWLTVILPTVAFGVAITFGSAFGWTCFRLHRWRKREGLTYGEFEKLMQAPDDSPFWKEPHIRRLLLPRPNSVEPMASLVPQTPATQVRAMSDAAQGFDGSVREIVDDAASAGKQILKVIESLDEQIHSLARDVDPEEQSRLEKKLSSLGEASGSESEGQRRMRALIEEQMKLAVTLIRQLEAAQQRRAQLVDLIKTLWLQVANLKSHAGEVSFDSGEISQEIRAISSDARRYVEASEETARLLESTKWGSD
ncbi:MAG: hypothetical protein ACE5HT_06555, partial [Gemmatimonadales bacterium]